jgi:hypothetical protein
MSQTNYINGIKFAKSSQYGVKFLIDVKLLTEELTKLQDDKGSVKVELKNRKSPDKFGSNMFAVQDTWVPTKTATQERTPVKEAEDDLPF